MIYKPFQDLKLSNLGFGTMRLPRLEDSSIDQAEVDRMVDLAIQNGINYFDTAYPYHDGKSELSIGKSLARYPRDSWYLADKFPGHQNVHGVRPMIPEDVFEDQLKKCGVDYFDFYLLHNVNENSMAYYCNPENHYLDYFLDQKAKGRIRHLGFSCHAGPEALKRFLDQFGDKLEFCQIQLNYLDWSLQRAEEKCQILKDAGLPIWVMESVRGGKLASFPEANEKKMKALRPDESIAAWAFRWLQTVPQPTMILSGMSNSAQMEDNIRTFSELRPLNETELAVLKENVQLLTGSIPCTGCRYCCAGCPIQLDIPNLMSMTNDLLLGGTSINTMMRYTALGDGHRADSCIACGQCREACPQKINVPAEMQHLVELVSHEKTWEEVCRERAEAAANSAG